MMIINTFLDNFDIYAQAVYLRLKVGYFALRNTYRIKRSLNEVVEYLFRLPPPLLAQHYIKSITTRGIYYIVSFKNLRRKMYWEKRLGLPALYGFTIEQFYPRHWHYYQIPQTHINAEDVVVDCGAAEGLFSLIAAETCQHVYAIEPLPNFITSLKKEFSGSKNVTIVERALGTEEKSVYITESLLASTISDQQKGKGIKVKMTSLDTLFYAKKKKFTYLKADLEGYEMHMLQGAKKSIQAYKPKIAITTYHHTYDVSEIHAFLKKLVPEYTFIIKGISEDKGQPIMLHAFVS